MRDRCSPEHDRFFGGFVSRKWLDVSALHCANGELSDTVVKREVDHGFMLSPIQSGNQSRRIVRLPVWTTIGDPTPTSLGVAKIKVDAAHTARRHVGHVQAIGAEGPVDGNGGGVCPEANAKAGRMMTQAPHRITDDAFCLRGKPIEGRFCVCPPLTFERQLLCIGPIPVGC